MACLQKAATTNMMVQIRSGEKKPLSSEASHQVVAGGTMGF
jgi:hypothetical protein